MPSLGPMEILVVLIVALLIFGPTKLPEVVRQAAKALRELNSFREQVMGEINDVINIDGGSTSSSQKDADATGTPTAPDTGRGSGADVPETTTAGNEPPASDPASGERTGARSDAVSSPPAPPKVQPRDLFGPGVGAGDATPTDSDPA